MADVNTIEKEVLDFWKKDKTFEKSLTKTKKGKPYIFYDGPPFATGLPHYGHILGSVTKDLFGRFWTMNGRYVRRVWGWDCHGLPIENIAEKDLGMSSKDEIEVMGVDKFNEYCRSKVLSFTSQWKEIMERIGRWVDMDHAYKTMDNDYIESVWWAFKELYDKGFIYKGERILPFCPRCSTPLAKAEIAMDNSYKTIKEETIVVKFKLKDEEGYILAWTTTPWTLPSNLALAVNPELDYVFLRYKKDGQVYVLAKDLIGNYYKSEDEYELIKTVKGRELEGLEYEPLFNYFADEKNAFKVLPGDFVTAEEGTGVVHIAPSFGEDDYNLGKEHGLRVIDSVNEKGEFTSKVNDFAGEYIHDSNRKIIDFLKSEGKVVLIKKMEHEYPFCYRCETKLFYRAVPAWFVDIQKIKPRVLELSQQINWHPEFLKEGRVKYTISTAPDWNISRNRYWAAAMPIWVSDDGEILVIGSVDELRKYAGKTKLPADLDLHKHTLDKVVLEKGGKKFKRTPEVFDCWFESGAMTFAQFHYPFENKKQFEESFPSQFVAEYIAQTRTWFYYMQVLSAILFDKFPFEHVVTTGTIVAEDGEKMSKSKNNFTDPMILVEKYGVDALRLYLLGSHVMKAEDMKFSDKGVDEIYKKVILILYNTLNFYEGYKTANKAGKAKLSDPTDKWIMSRLNEFGFKTRESFMKYDTIEATNEIKNFVNDLSTWYVRVNRDRFNDGDEQAVATLRHVLDTFAKVVAPIIPFSSEYVYRTINENAGSVHLEIYPEFNEKDINREIINEMEEVREIVSRGLKTRDQVKIGLKWPLAQVSVSVKDSKSLSKYESLVMQELNVKKVVSKKGKELGVELDTEMTSELEAEGFARELCRRVQAERKERGLTRKDEIVLEISAEKGILKRLEEFSEMIKGRTGAKKVNFTDENIDGGVYFEVKEEKISFNF